MAVTLAATVEAATLRRGGGRSSGGRGGGGRDDLYDRRTSIVNDDRTGVVVAFETPDQEQFQYGRPGEAVFGAYR